MTAISQVWGAISLRFWLTVPRCLVMLSIFSCACWPICMSSLGKCLFRGLPMFQLEVFFWRWVVWVLCIFWILVFFLLVGCLPGGGGLDKHHITLLLPILLGLLFYIFSGIHTIHTNVQSNLDLGGFRLICGNTKGVLWLCTKGSDRGSKKRKKSQKEE